jgi:hypothetical protein
MEVVVVVEDPVLDMVDKEDMVVLLEELVQVVGVVQKVLEDLHLVVLVEQVLLAMQASAPILPFPLMQECLVDKEAAEAAVEAPEKMVEAVVVVEVVEPQVFLH